MKVLELTNFSAGGCGVYARVKAESELLSKHHDVRIFSSNLVKGSIATAPQTEKIGKVLIKRFPAIKLGGESFMYWNFSKAAQSYKPDIIVAHGYRHLHTTQALKIGKKMNIPVLLVTHAPFVEKDATRTYIEKTAVKIYDHTVGQRTINKFAKVAIISLWEKEYLKKLKVKNSKIVYLPNGISEEYFIGKPKEGIQRVLFLGRVSPIKDLETLIKAITLTKNNLNLEIVGPIEKDYGENLRALIKNLNVQKRVTFHGAVYNLSKKIKIIDKSILFVLPSKKEGMPQALIEAMARERIVLAADNQGCRAIIKTGVNGYLFKVGNEKDLAEKIDKAIESKTQIIRKNARESVKEYLWPVIIKKIETAIKESISQLKNT